MTDVQRWVEDMRLKADAAGTISIDGRERGWAPLSTATVRKVCDVVEASDELGRVAMEVENGYTAAHVNDLHEPRLALRTALDALTREP